VKWRFFANYDQSPVVTQFEIGTASKERPAEAGRLLG